MKIAATGMLVAMAAIFFAARTFAGRFAWAPFVEAFAEAAMVGGLADWFAVTALFRHPLGVPIPHTAIIPRNKDRLGDNLAQFLKNNFLTPGVVARRLERLDLAGSVGRWLAAPPENARLRGSVGKLAVQLIDALDNESVGAWIRGSVGSSLRRLELSPLLGRILDSSIDEGRLQPLVDSGIHWLARVLQANEGMIREMVEARTMWILRLAALDERFANSIIEALRRLLDEMAADHDHPLRIKVMVGLKDFAFDLQHMSETRDKVEQLKQEMIDNPELGNFLDGLWGSAKASLRKALADPAQALTGRLGEIARQLGEAIESDPELQKALNKYARRAIVGIVADYGDALVRIVSDTVRGWDARTVTERVENAVGRDLQFIRINGTLVGGLVGLIIYAVSGLV